MWVTCPQQTYFPSSPSRAAETVLHLALMSSLVRYLWSVEVRKRIIFVPVFKGRIFCLMLGICTTWRICAWSLGQFQLSPWGEIFRGLPVKEKNLICPISWQQQHQRIPRDKVPTGEALKEVGSYHWNPCWEKVEQTQEELLRRHRSTERGPARS